LDITVAGISKDFGDAAALSGVDLKIRSGELVALLGPSGSGKTTLLRVIAGLEIPDQGRVLFGDEDATVIPVQQRQVGFVFQHYALFRHLTVFDNIAYGLRARGRARRPAEAEIRRRVTSLLDLVQLDGLERRFPAQLSGGQRQRVALARALAVEPRVLLLDEPFGALDAKVRKDLRRWLRDIHDRTGQTTVFVTHDQDEALELADRVAVLNQGRLEQVGTPGEVYDEPASPFVMAFVGDTARLPVELRQGEIWFGGCRTGLRVERQPDGPGDLYVRPWDLAVAENGPESLRAVVASAHRSGQATRAAMALDGSGIMIEVDVPRGRPVDRGDRLHLTLTGGRLFRE
jgi:sulfate/thiosulfate transport system ATP-binding protein